MPPVPKTVRVRSRTLLRELRLSAKDDAGLSLREAAERLPCGKSMIQALESGAITTCTETLGDRIAEVYGVAPRVLFAPAPSVKRGRPAKVRGQESAA